MRTIRKALLCAGLLGASVASLAGNSPEMRSSRPESEPFASVVGGGLGLTSGTEAVLIAQKDSSAPETGSQPTKTSNSRFTLKDGEAFDTKTHLTWQRCSVGQQWKDNACTGVIQVMTWRAAQDAGNETWRLPTKEELSTLIDDDRKRQNVKPTINVEAFPAMDSDKLLYWTSDGGEDGCWYVGFAIGNTDRFTYGGYCGDSGFNAAVRLVKKGN